MPVPNASMPGVLMPGFCFDKLFDGLHFRNRAQDDAALEHRESVDFLRVGTSFHSSPNGLIQVVSDELLVRKPF